MHDDKSKQPKYIYTNYANGVRHSPTRHKKTNNSSKKTVFIILILVIIGFGIWYMIPSDKAKSKAESVVNVFHPATKKPVTPAPQVNQAALAAMENSVNSVITGNSAITFEVAVTDLNTGSQLNFGDTAPMTAASVSKIITATDWFNDVQEGKESMSENLNDGNTASFDMKQLIVISSDSAWAAFDDDLGTDQLERYASSIGVTSFDYDSNTLTARDTANVLTNLYQGRLINAANTKLLLSYMEQANYRTYILPAIPSGDTVYHKIGLYEDNVNDATIITNGNQTISLVIFTNGNGTYDWPQRALLMQEITKPILAYYGLN